MDELAGVLSRERLLLELLLFKLVELRQLLSAGEARFLTWAAEEVGRATDKVREVELRRAVALARAAAELDLPADATLRAVTERAPAPYQAIFAEHRTALLALTTEVEAMLELTRRLAGSGAHAVADLLDQVAGAQPALAGAPAVGPTYGPAGGWQQAAAPARYQQRL